MMTGMKQRMIQAGFALMAMLAAPLAALAARPEAEREILDGRLEGYASNVTLEGGSTGLTWVVFIILTIVCLAGLFKDAKRTHLD
jgi:hypothetical protein